MKSRVGCCPTVNEFGKEIEKSWQKVSVTRQEQVRILGRERAQVCPFQDMNILRLEAVDNKHNVLKIWDLNWNSYSLNIKQVRD